MWTTYGNLWMISIAINSQQQGLAVLERSPSERCDISATNNPLGATGRAVEMRMGADGTQASQAESKAVLDGRGGERALAR